MQTGLPFETTPQIKRYLEELTLPAEFDSEGSKNVIETFSVGERLSEGSFANVDNFLKFLRDEKLIKLDEMPKIVKINDSKGVRPKNLKITVLDEEALQDLATHIDQKRDAKVKNSRAHWNPWTRTLSYRDVKPYTFHIKKHGDTARLRLFKLLWENKKHEIGGKVIVGKPQEPRFVAAHIGLTQNTRTDSYNDSGVQKAGDQAKYLGTALKKRFPIRITTRGGIQMILKE